MLLVFGCHIWISYGNRFCYLNMVIFKSQLEWMLGLRAIGESNTGYFQESVGMDVGS
jgi:hypothetical protein